MQKFLYYLTSIFVSFLSLQAQESTGKEKITQFQGIAVYESKTSTADIKSRFEGNKDITPEMQKMIEDRMKAAFEKTFILSFDKSASIYKEEEKLDAPGQAQGGGMKMMTSMLGGGGTFYDRVYEADRPELFFKSTPHRTVGPGGHVRLRADSKWNVPEPELTLAVSAQGKIFAVSRMIARPHDQFRARPSSRL